MTAGMTFRQCNDHLSLIQAMAKAYPPHSINEASAEAYLLALHDVPLSHCAQAALELIRRHVGDFIPSPGRWRAIAADFWNEALCEAESAQQRIELKPPNNEQRAALRRELHKDILERAASNPFFASIVESLDRGKLLKLPPKSSGERLEEINGDLDREHAERLTKLTPEQFEARRQSILRVHGPEKGGAAVSDVRFVCDGCGAALLPGSEAYRGPAPGKVGDSALCDGCRPRYSWAQKPPKKRRRAATA